MMCALQQRTPSVAVSSVRRFLVISSLRARARAVLIHKRACVRCYYYGNNVQHYTRAALKQSITERGNFRLTLHLPPRPRPRNSDFLCHARIGIRT